MIDFEPVGADTRVTRSFELHPKSAVARPALGQARQFRPVAFAHNAEAELAALLDFYGIEWEYEPTTFVLETGPDGCPTLAFTPDFFLPAFACFVEVTTLDQKLVTKKNRKVRRLRELHPQLDVRVIYQRDYQHLLVKYGLAVPQQHVGERKPPRVSAGEALGLLGSGPVPVAALADDGLAPSQTGAA